LIFNFKHARLEWERTVLTKDLGMSASEGESAQVDLQAPQQWP
jgi:hypothetical protein